jgi:uncharacterized protein YeaO (DUF488 family)
MVETRAATTQRPAAEEPRQEERMSIRVKRVYDDRSPEDGARVLVDRVWPRGVKKEDAQLDDWAKDVAPSTELRKWYGHDPDKFDEFTKRYRKELESGDARGGLDRLRESAREGDLTLLTASKAVDISQATVLATLLGESS